jgi:hypothetical protein
VENHTARKVYATGITASYELRPLPPLLRFDSIREKVEHYLDKTHPNGCWVWTRALGGGGYGYMGWGGKVVRVHRAYVKDLGWDVPDDMHIDHLCRNRACSNPDHLEVVTHAENIRRGVGVGKRVHPVTHCPKGHPYDEANTYITKSGSQACRACHVVWTREYLENKRNRTVT